MYLKNFDFKKYLGLSVKFADKKKLNPNNYLPIWSCTFSCGEQKACKYGKHCKYLIRTLKRSREVSVLCVYEAWFQHTEGKRQLCSKATEQGKPPSASQLMAGISRFVLQLLFQLEL